MWSGRPTDEWFWARKLEGQLSVEVLLIWGEEFGMLNETMRRSIRKATQEYRESQGGVSQQLVEVTKAWTNNPVTKLVHNNGHYINMVIENINNLLLSMYYMNL